MTGRRRGVAGALVCALAAVACTADDVTVVVIPESVAFASDLPGDTWSVSSPDDGLRIDVGLDDGAPVYRVVRTIDGTELTVLGRSALGMETSLGSLGSDLTLADAGRVERWTDSFTLPTGKQRSSSLDGRLRTLRFDAPLLATDVDLEIDLLATDHGVAFRSRAVAGGSAIDTEIELDWERTSFAVPPDSLAWLQNHDRNGFGRPAYEQRRSTARAVSDPISSPDGWTLPALFETDDMWTLVAEAGLEGGGAGSHLSTVSSNGRFSLALPSQFDGNGVGAVEPSGALPFITPWRVVVTSADLNDIVETNLVRHLSAPGADMPWVEPGAVSWSWWSDQESPRNTESLRTFVDLAADFGWPYSLIDANWDDIPEDEFRDLVAYAAERDVGLILWYNSGGPNNAVTEAPRGRMTDRLIRRTEMARIADLGIRGIKVDFFHSDKPTGIQQYLDILEDAADFELLVNFHGSTVPRGWSRTWPNLMSMEAVLGGEQYIFNPGYPSIAPVQNTVLPFTRNAVGSMDYTPVTLGNRYLRRTSNGHELALAVVFESGLQHFVDTPETYGAQPDEVRAVLSDVPVAWDETRFLAGRPDEFVMLARREGDAWWVGVINGSPLERTVSFDPADLGVGGRIATVLCDGDDKRAYDISSIELDGAIDLVMLDEGGCVIRIT